MLPLAMDPAPAAAPAPAPAPAQPSTSTSTPASHRSGTLKFKAVSGMKLRSIVAWARLESSRRRGGASGHGNALDSLSMKLKCGAAGIPGVGGAPGGRLGENGAGASVDASAGGACLLMVSYLRDLK